MKKIAAFILTLCLLVSVGLTGLAEETAPIYVALGDSITSGYGLAEDELSFPQIVAQANGYTLINYGVDGNTATGILAQLATPAILADVMAADVITITCGGNDLLALLYERMAELYNANVPATLASMQVEPGQITTIMADKSDPRQQALLLAAKTVLEGNAAMGIPAFQDSEELQAAVTAYVQNMLSVLAGINKVNPEATLIIATQYNPYGLFAGEFEILSVGVEAGANMLNQIINQYSGMLGYKVADVYSAVAASAENLMNASMEPLELDFHPNAAGHAVIAECINAVLNPAE